MLLTNLLTNELAENYQNFFKFQVENWFLEIFRVMCSNFYSGVECPIRANFSLKVLVVAAHLPSLSIVSGINEVKNGMVRR